MNKLAVYGLIFMSGLDLKIKDKGENYWCREPHLNHELSSNLLISPKLIDNATAPATDQGDSKKPLLFISFIFLMKCSSSKHYFMYQKNYDYILQWNLEKFLTSNMRFQRNFMLVHGYFGPHQKFSKGWLLRYQGIFGQKSYRKHCKIWVVTYWIWTCIFK